MLEQFKYEAEHLPVQIQNILNRDDIDRIIITPSENILAVYIRDSKEDERYIFRMEDFVQEREMRTCRDKDFRTCLQKSTYILRTEKCVPAQILVGSLQDFSSRTGVTEFAYGIPVRESPDYPEHTVLLVGSTSYDDPIRTVQLSILMEWQDE